MSIKSSPEIFDLECSSVWSFPRRWNRATHNSKYRGNRSPEVVRNIILRYSKEWDNLMDCMIWWWTTAIECKLLNRNLQCFDVNPNSIQLVKNLLQFESEHNPNIHINYCDARNLKKYIEDESIDFILTHPPYVDIIKYSEWKISEDISWIHDIDKFCDEIEKIANECYRTLKKWKYCAILMWDTRRNKMYQPLAFKVMQRFLNVWFSLREDIVKIQHNCKATGFWINKSKEANFLLIMHEHLFIFQKL